eukprot:472814-Amphidinium_carterae.1
MNDRRAWVYDEEPSCAFCQEGFGTPHHVVFECPAFAQQRKEAQVGMFREDVPACVQTFGLGIQFPQPLAPTEEICAGTTTDTLLFTDGSGKNPAEPAHRKCNSLTHCQGAGNQSTRLSCMPS